MIKNRDDRIRVTRYTENRLNGREILPLTNPSEVAKKVGCRVSIIKDYIINPEWRNRFHDKDIQAEFDRLGITKDDIQCARIILMDKNPKLWEL